MEYKITKYSELSSTNTEAANTENFEHLECITAERQTSGRGRMGRSFHSEGGGLYMSVLLKPSEINCTLPLVTFAAAVSLTEALRSLSYKVGIKWVNDILYNGKKAAGILTEAKTKDNKLERIIVGIGVNLKEPDGGFPDEIKDKATSLGYTGDKDILIGLILSRLCENLQKTAHGFATVAHFMLIRRRHFGKGHALFGNVKIRIVAKAVFSACIADNLPVTTLLHDKGTSVGENAGNRRHVVCSTLTVGDILQGIEKLAVILVISGMLACIPCRKDTRRTAEGIHSQARIISNADVAKLCADTCLDQSIFSKAIAILNDFAVKTDVIKRKHFNIAERGK